MPRPIHRFCRTFCRSCAVHNPFRKQYFCRYAHAHQWCTGGVLRKR
ncbi:MAG: zinc-finger domain-containing protein [Kiritimatiellae bacterium]|nr:zinc-finger domain-containing protein [Kiritimatiellia bacterium]